MAVPPVIAVPELPDKYRAVRVHKLSTDFDAATKIDELPMAELLESMETGDALVQTRFAGINASDINFSAGRYDPTMKPPFTAGFEGMGVLVRLGAGGSGHVNTDQPAARQPFTVGASVGYITYGTFADYVVVPVAKLIPLPKCEAKFFGAMVSGLTAAISLSELGRPAESDTVLITAAAGGAGQIAVQWAKHHCKCRHVIGTCSTKEKADMLRRIGCDRVILYKDEDLGKVLRTEYPAGVNVVFESVGGPTMKACLRSLAPRGRLLVIGAMSTYKEGSDEKKLAWEDSVNTAELLVGSKTVSGFLLTHFVPQIGTYAPQLIAGIAKGDLEVQCDSADYANGLDSIHAAVAHLQSGRSMGKVVVEFSSI